MAPAIPNTFGLTPNSGVSSMFSGMRTSTPAIPTFQQGGGIFMGSPNWTPATAVPRPLIGDAPTNSATPDLSASFNQVRGTPPIPGTTASNIMTAHNIGSSDGGNVNAATGAYTPPAPQNNAIDMTKPWKLPGGNMYNPANGQVTDPNGNPVINAPAQPNAYQAATTGLVGYGQNGSAPTNAATSNLLSLAANNPATSGPAYQDYQSAVNDYTGFQKGLQVSLGNTGRQPIPMPFIQGQQQVINTQNAGILAALQGNVAAKQAAIGLGIQGQQTQNSGLSSAASAAQGEQSLGQSALANAASLTKPEAGATFFGTPETGGMVGNGSQNMATAVALQAQKLQNGTTDPASAMSALSAYGQAGMNALQQSLGPNFNLPAAAGSAAATQSNTTLGGTATPNAANSVYQKAYSDYQDLQANVANVDQFGSLLTSGMVAPDGTTINPTSDKYANMKISQFRNQLSSPQQAQFDSTYAALKGKITGMLSIGGNETPTSLTNDASQVLDGSAPMGTLQATLARIQAEGNTLLTTQGNKVNDAKSNITPPKSGTSLGTGGGTSKSSTSGGWGSLGD